MSVESSQNPRAKRGGGRPIGTNLVLAAVLFLVCGFAYWLELRKRTDPVREFQNKPRLIAFDTAQEVESLHIVDKEKSIDFQMTCKDHCKISDPAADWRIASPMDFKADGANIGTFLSGAMSAVIQETIPVEGTGEAAEKALSQFGLEKAKREGRKAVFKLKKDAEPYTIYLGDTAAVGENVYAMVEGPGFKLDSVKIVPSYVRTNVQRSLSYWRSKKLFDFSVSEVEGFRLRNPRGTVEVARDGQDWKIGPEKALADNEAVDTWLTGLVFMNAHDYLTDDKAKDGPKFGIGPRTDHFELWVRVAKKPEVKVEIYDFVKDKEPRLYATFSNKDFLVSLERTMAEKFTKTRDDFRFHKLLTAAEKERIARFTVKLAAGDTFEFKRGETAWSLASGKLDKFDPSTVDQALLKLGSAKISEFNSTMPRPKDTPELSSWTLFDKDGAKIRALTVYGSARIGEYFVKAGNQLSKLDRFTGSLVPSKAESFQKAAPVPAPNAPHQKPGVAPFPGAPPVRH